MPERFGATLDLHRQVFAQSWPLAMSSSASSPQPTAPGDLGWLRRCAGCRLCELEEF